MARSGTTEHSEGVEDDGNGEGGEAEGEEDGAEEEARRPWGLRDP